MKKIILILLLVLALSLAGTAGAAEGTGILPGSDENAVEFSWRGDFNIGKDKTITVKVYDESYIHTKNFDGEEKDTVIFLVFHESSSGWGKAIKYLPGQKFKGPGGYVEKTYLPLQKIGDRWIGKVTIVPRISTSSIQIWKSQNTGKVYYGIDVQLAKSNRGELIKIDKKPEEGFYWDYYLYIPQEISTDESANYSNHMLVQPNNTGKFNDDIEVHDEAARRLADKNPLAQELGTPVLVPVFSRPKTLEDAPHKGWLYYTHSLDRQTLSLKIEKYKRLDKQLVAMMEHARDLLAQKEIKLEEKVFMFGYSASGTFTNRFITLHPEKVQAIAAGGINGLPTLPLKEIDNKKLYYPVGVFDIEELTGIEFDLEAYKDIPQYLFLGSEDTNDTLPYPAPYDDREKEIIKEVFNTEPIPIKEQGNKENAGIIVDRFNRAKDLYEQEDIPAQFVIYEGLGHTLTPEIIRDVAEFFRRNAANKLHKISPHNY